MKSSRLLSILMRLQMRGHTTARELADELEVSVRTVLRDVDALSAAGVPIYAERGTGGGLRLREGWTTDLTGLTAPEAHALVLAGLPEAAVQLGLGHAAASARDKLLAGLDRSGRAIAGQVMRRLHVDCWIGTAPRKCPRSCWRQPKPSGKATRFACATAVGFRCAGASWSHSAWY